MTNQQENKTYISIHWWIEDVQEVAQEKFDKNLSDDDAFKVLQFARSTHNACVGINWDVLYSAIETLEKSGDITLLEEKAKFETGAYGYISDDQITKEYGE